MASTLLESFELLIQAEQLAPRLAAAVTALAQLPGLEGEKAWLAAADARLAAVGPGAHGALLNRALRLPELESMKAERGKLLQGAIADEVERLQAGIAYAGGQRSPLLDVLFHNLKVPALRKCPRAELEKFCAELEHRLTSSYAKRMFASKPYSEVMPAVQAMTAAVTTWRRVFVDAPLAGAAAEALADELLAAGRSVELALRQARLLATAALLVAPELLEHADVITARAKKRGKDTDEDAPALLEKDPPDPQQPTADERAEIAALHER